MKRITLLFFAAALLSCANPQRPTSPTRTVTPFSVMSGFSATPTAFRVVEIVQMCEKAIELGSEFPLESREVIGFDHLENPLAGNVYETYCKRVSGSSVTRSILKKACFTGERAVLISEGYSDDSCRAIRRKEINVFAYNVRASLNGRVAIDFPQLETKALQFGDVEAMEGERKVYEQYDSRCSELPWQTTDTIEVTSCVPNERQQQFSVFELDEDTVYFGKPTGQTDGSTFESRHDRLDLNFPYFLKKSEESSGI